MKFNSCSVPGPKGENQDAVLPPFETAGGTWCAIADGVGSSALGGVAARASLEVVRQINGNYPMAEVFAAVQRRLSEIAGEQAAKSISTTLSVLRVREDKAFVG